MKRSVYYNNNDEQSAYKKINHLFKDLPEEGGDERNKN
jgi:hypothetical protein